MILSADQTLLSGSTSFSRVAETLAVVTLHNRNWCSKFLHLLQSKRFMRALTSKLCAEVWKTRYECSLSPGNENSKLEMETPKFPAKIDFNFHWNI